MDRQIVYPDNEDGEIDGKNPEHQDEDGMGVIVEIGVGVGASLFGESKGASAGCYLDEARNKIRKLVWNSG